MHFCLWKIKFQIHFFLSYLFFGPQTRCHVELCSAISDVQSKWSINPLSILIQLREVSQRLWHPACSVEMKSSELLFSCRAIPSEETHFWISILAFSHIYKTHNTCWLCLRWGYNLLHVFTNQISPLPPGELYSLHLYHPDTSPEDQLSRHRKKRVQPILVCATLFILCWSWVNRRCYLWGCLKRPADFSVVFWEDSFTFGKHWLICKAKQRLRWINSYRMDLCGPYEHGCKEFYFCSYFIYLFNCAFEHSGWGEDYQTFWNSENALQM